MTDTTRDASLRQMLTARRAGLQDAVLSHLRQGRSNRPAEGRDDLERSDDHISGDLSFALLQMKSEAVHQLGDALARLDQGQYGHCADCERPIARQRLHALPFAVRCQPCAGRREQERASDAVAAPWHAVS
ncbi:MAG TPA: TraR/DksA C4-type zinc finger protein [Vicinamibacterales bacterium]|nr:TraR/DksA C4-type zinc finger protein [Vicinamibacterales bacterium]